MLLGHRPRPTLLDLKGSRDVLRFVAEAGLTEARSARLEIIERMYEETVGDPHPYGRYFAVTASNPST